MGAGVIRIVIVLSAVVTSLLTDPAAAQDLRFEFTIDGQISGTRPWDGTASSSSAIDGSPTGLSERIARGVGSSLGENGGLLGRIADGAIGTAVDVGIDEAQATMAPPDPYLCIIEVHGTLSGGIDNGATMANGQFSAACTPKNKIKPNRLQFSLDLPPNIARLPIFGVALIDNDLTDMNNNQVQASSDELIGFGLYIRADVRAKIVEENDPDALQLVQIYQRELPTIIDGLFGLQRTRVGSGHALELERLSAEGCRQSCRFGDASLTIKDTIGGW